MKPIAYSRWQINSWGSRNDRLPLWQSRYNKGILAFDGRSLRKSKKLKWTKKKPHGFSCAEQGTRNVYEIVSNVAPKWGAVCSHFTTGSSLSSVTEIFVGEASTFYNIFILFGLHKGPSRGKQYFCCFLMHYQIWYSLNTYLGSNVILGST